MDLQGITTTRGGRKRTADDAFAGVENANSLRKLHNIAIWVRSSSLHTDLWRQKVGPLLGVDNATRWSSWHTLIGKALKVQDSMTLFLLANDSAIGDNILTGADWDYLKKVHQLLQPFAAATLLTEGDKSHLAQSLMVMDILLGFYEKQKVM